MITPFDIKIMREAIKISKACPISLGAYSVGAIIVDQDKEIISTGYSRESGDNTHAEEVAIEKVLIQGIDLAGMTLYTTMEPCGLRLSGKKCCADRIIENQIQRCVYGIPEPPFLVQNCTGATKLIANGIIIDQIFELKEEIEEINRHIK